MRKQILLNRQHSILSNSQPDINYSVQEGVKAKPELWQSKRHESREVVDECEPKPCSFKQVGGNANYCSKIITNTFKPLIPPEQAIPNGMVPKLLHRFWCDEGYTLFEDVQPLIRKLREAHKAENTRVVIGVITNSDDRVPDILTSFGLKVSPLRYGGHYAKSSETTEHEQYDVDFSVMSYDVGHEKPDKRIFEAAEEVLQTSLLRDEDGRSVEWRKVYVGDEYEKDVVGALNAGWNVVLIDRETAGQRQDLEWLDEKPVASLFEFFQHSRAVGFRSLDKLAQWLLSR